LDFEFPSETARREAKAKENGKGKERREVDTYDVDEEGRGAFADGGGHINFFAELEKNVCSN
jgi:hypothetical protein